MSRISGAIFNSDGSVRSIGKGTPQQFNTDLRTGQTWREIPDEVRWPHDVPPLESLPPHPELSVSE